MPHTDELDVLAATPIILHALLDGNTSGRPAGDEGWAPNEVVAHLRDCEERFLQRCETMLQQDDPFLDAFDQEQLARENDYRSVDAPAALASFDHFRRQMIEFLTALDDTDWQRAGDHQEQGRTTIENQVRRMIRHDLAHMRQIAESVARLP